MISKNKSFFIVFSSCSIYYLTAMASTLVGRMKSAGLIEDAELDEVSVSVFVSVFVFVFVFDAGAELAAEP